MIAATPEVAQIALRFFRNGLIFQQKIGEADNRRQGIVHFVSHAGNKLTERGHFLSVHQLCLQVGGFGHVGHYHDDAVNLPLIVTHGTQAD